MKKNNSFLALILIITAFSLQGCIPALVGGGVVVGTAFIKEKGVTGSMSDAKIATAIRVNFYQSEGSSLRPLSIEVQNGEVLLTGTVKSEEAHLKALKIVWKVKGVHRVIDSIQLEKVETFGGYAGDSWITTQLKSQMLFDGNIMSRNYTIHTYHRVIYILGIAQNQEELDKVAELARHLEGVKKVLSYVRLKDDPMVR